MSFLKLSDGAVKIMQPSLIYGQTFAFFYKITILNSKNSKMNSTKSSLQHSKCSSKELLIKGTFTHLHVNPDLCDFLLWTTKVIVVFWDHIDFHCIEQHHLFFKTSLLF